MPEIVRPIPAVALRALVPVEYLRLLADWAEAIATFQDASGDHTKANKAHWMRAVLNPDWEDGRCDGLSPANRGMWAECGSTEPHHGHDQQRISHHLPEERFMGREIKRVPIDFDWKRGEVWQGYLMPDTLAGVSCVACDGSGYSPHARALHDLWYGKQLFDPTTTGSVPLTVDTPEVRAFAERNIAHAPDFYGTGEPAVRREAQRLADLWNGMWCHHLAQEDVDALIAADRLWDFTRTWSKQEGWQRIEPIPVITAEQVNRWSLHGSGHDSISCHVVIKARCERQGVPDTCAVCKGRGETEVYPGQRAEAEAWRSIEPPAGDGWQLWETVSEGSPISPVFATAEELAGWMSDPSRPGGRDWMPYPVAMDFIRAGWAPSFIASAGTGVVPGAEWVGMRDEATEA